VTILASGDVVVDGTIDVSGKAGNNMIPGEGGPGGFDGGVGGAPAADGKRGEGPGGGVGGKGLNNYAVGSGEGGAYAGSGGDGYTYFSNAPGGSGSVGYGNERIIPLIGGSGGGGGGGARWGRVGGAGGGGGGAILIASSTSITVNGAILAKGGRGADGANNDDNGGGGGGGAGGAIRLVTNALNGNGTISAAGGAGGFLYQSKNYKGGNGSAGRIRLEYVTTNRTAGTNPPMSVGYALSVLPPDMPTLKIVSIAGVNAPDVPKGDYNAPDVVLPYGSTNPVPVVVSAVNVPAGATVTVTANPAVGGATSAAAPLAGTNTSSSATVDLSISLAYPCVLTASVEYVLTASLGGPLEIDGELVARVRVSASFGGPSRVTYITASGREISAVM